MRGNSHNLLSNFAGLSSKRKVHAKSAQRDRKLRDWMAQEQESAQFFKPKPRRSKRADSFGTLNRCKVCEGDIHKP